MTTTKHNILFDTARIFDHPRLNRTDCYYHKIKVASLWQTQVDWHEPVSEEKQHKWHEYKISLSKLNELAIPPQITIVTEINDIQIQGFTDVSERTYGCCLFLRCSDKAGKHFSNLLSVKFKIAPMKTMSLPRLELCAAQLLVHVAYNIILKIQLKLSKNIIGQVWRLLYAE